MGRPREAPELPADPVEALIEDTRSRGADPDFYTAGARWKREADIPDDVYFRALRGDRMKEGRRRPPSAHSSAAPSSTSWYTTIC